MYVAKSLWAHETKNGRLKPLLAYETFEHEVLHFAVKPASIEFSFF
uniref:Uncharacterized protein n=1 Tax=Curvibacter symbiont subsp. Hydra magnipapillata TaxID=667019 RepID=C9Y8V2_CURXX|nr:hypothetical protein Csp_A05530 [Curvibacter putative symbiont of Hydra magnipapillata]